MTAATDLFVEEARAVSLEHVGELVGVTVKGTGDEKVGPCPACGGRDRFNINYKKGLWHCRNRAGGGDGLELIAYKFGYDLSTRSGLLAACGDILGRPVPEGGATETDTERAAREARVQKLRDDQAKHQAQQAQSNAAFRDKAIAKARGIYLKATESDAASPVAEYLRRRTGFAMPDGVFANLRFDPRHTYWHGVDERGQVAEVHCGPAMIAPFVGLDCKITGCHETWIDLGNEPKFRPNLGGDLPTKKMQGVKKGSLIPLHGLMTSARWVGGEGIENGLAFAGAEGFRDDTFYFASGDLGNLAGPAEQSSAFTHPTLKKPDAKGVERAVRVAGPVPKVGQSANDALQVADHVNELLLLADGDSEFIMTVAAMCRAEARLARDGLSIDTAWPDDGTDWAKVLSEAAQAMAGGQ